MENWESSGQQKHIIEEKRGEEILFPIREGS